MKLYYLPDACSLAIHIILDWIGEPYDTEAMTREGTKSPEYLTLNPAGAVPALVDGARVLTQNSAIQKYLIEKYPRAHLGPDPTPEGNYELNHWHGFLGGARISHPAEGLPAPEAVRREHAGGPRRRQGAGR